MAEINDGSPFFALAVAYQKSGDVLIEHMDVDASLDTGLPVRFVYSHAIELFLKAFLSMAGVPAERLATKEFGHNLTVLFQASVGAGLAMASVDRSLQLDYVITSLSPGHAKYLTRYLDCSFNTVEPAWIQRCVGALANLVGYVVEVNRAAFVEAAKSRGQVLLSVPKMLVLSISQ